MKWWCSASDAPWEWTWRPYPGIWSCIALIAACYLAGRRHLRRHRPTDDDTPLRTLSFAFGLMALWVGIDWPIGALGAGYLLSAHTVTYVLLCLIAPPFMLAGVPPTLVEMARSRPPLWELLRFLARPLTALLLFNVTLVVTHLPDVVDGFMRTQLGSMAIDLGWLLSGLVLWWPVLAPKPSVGTMSEPAKLGYLFAATLLPTVPAAFFTFADYPAYALYELSPRVFPMLDAATDQQLAGLTMKVIGDIPLWVGFGVVFFRWQRSESGSTPSAPLPTVR
jgi:cytochrome c oxidase assembly factor CtaG